MDKTDKERIDAMLQAMNEMLQWALKVEASVKKLEGRVSTLEERQHITWGSC